MKAVMKGQIEIYKSLSKIKGIDFNFQNEDGQTILHIIATMHLNEEMQNEILKNDKIDVNIQNKDLRTPLHLAIDNYNISLATHLINNKKTNLNLIDNLQRTPLIQILYKMGDAFSRYYRESNENSNLEKLALLIINSQRLDIFTKDKSISIYF